MNESHGRFPETDEKQGRSAAMVDAAGMGEDRGSQKWNSGGLQKNSQGGNDMKRMKKILAVLLAAIMVMSLGSVSVMADDIKVYTITIKSSLANRTYVAYQLFTGTIDTDGSLTDVVTGNGVDVFDDSGSEDAAKIEQLTRAMMESKEKISIKTGYSTLGALFTAAGAVASQTTNSSAAVIASILAEYGNKNNTNGDESVLVAFAKEVSTFLVKTNEISIYDSQSLTTDGVTTYTYNFKNLKAGYYLILDKTSLNSTDDAYSRYMLVMTTSDGNNTVTIESKEEVPTLTKTLSDGTDSTSKSIGDTVTYKLTTTIPDTTGYSEYTYKITDILSSGLELVTSDSGNASGSLSPLAIKVKLSTATEDLDGIRLADENDTTSTDSYDYYYYTSSDSSGTTLTIVFTNFLSVAVSAASSDDIIITYDAKLTSDAVVGSGGNENTAKLTYSNNPYGTTTSVTTEDKVTVYTYQIDFTKVDAANISNTLSGAKFYLTKKDEGTTYYATVSQSSNVYKVTGWTTTDVSTDNLIESGSNGKFSIIGLGGDATFYLYEKEAPSGYTTWGTDEAVAITITVTTDSESGETTLSATATGDGTTAATWQGVWSTGVITATVTNSSSSIIPSTGGIGTTIFYIVGAILVVGASVILITRRRMGNRA